MSLVEERHAYSATLGVSPSESLGMKMFQRSDPLVSPLNATPSGSKSDRAVETLPHHGSWISKKSAEEDCRRAAMRSGPLLALMEWKENSGMWGRVGVSVELFARGLGAGQASWRGIAIDAGKGVTGEGSDGVGWGVGVRGG